MLRAVVMVMAVLAMRMVAVLIVMMRFVVVHNKKRASSPNALHTKAGKASKQTAQASSLHVSWSKNSTGQNYATNAEDCLWQGRKRPILRQ